ncbi:3'(2'),5'-bisphosphate nucleotidase CysQ [Pseudoalteromonas luteoviolacea]|uniref:3'(2'),5'-bisphosphate nucleotidase CysQ n=1 Tax=Pseudoalteromonas luteoviolacea S4054 TaxID=1129367 RepID=A0A0F6AAJ7_9GAMM|nr:3'(2'),5'-bisphosphate nucleotidase CysQ [Pseudoalteromonas luteoviolacea]AOT06499.1 3'(2'),5'-bisphosphate nucleotidase CysQ [Pseudoalteromonas luteoviolacea]AOT11416.1 3'(2'),5'-bisphosphate nucleotidase CysQ [Pseudoalteromonas luteoviolacea]AOT16329.1 3'(2'),5'-bisphosphate nucleotidase CysQ [Pseudoalteromonas luteoviolacea]KKE83237.1 3'-5'-bisphosphate nucleotidase [Pseudoalteromonas luteoviolacea S4054]KZN71168.1 3'-5'-bisphosphate nucleotidase [Pseudoalteromonas luteoviolacea S4047-1]
MQTYLEPCIELAQLAGQAIMAIYQQDDIGQQEKSDHTPVTAADLAANEVLLNGLKSLAPDIPVMSEETPIPPLEQRQDWQRYWLLDPMDGTGEFILQSGDFAVNIALIEGNQPVLGVIHWPAKNVTYFATKGAGAYKRSGATDEQIFVASPDTLTLAVSRRQKIEAVSQYLNSQFDTIALGSCSLKACIIAEGKADCFLRVGPTGEWDTGASQVIVEEAGGCITDAQFNPLTYNQRETTENPDFIVMGHPDWQFQKLISPHQR